MTTYIEAMNPPRKLLIQMSGAPGSGKTTLAEKLAKHYGWTPLYESVDQNPYLRGFYEDMARWAFHLQIYFCPSEKLPWLGLLHVGLSRVFQNPRSSLFQRG